MNIQKKILLLVGGLLAVFIAALILIDHEHNSGIEQVYRESVLERSAAFEKVVKLKGEPLAKLAADYSYWDEMVAFVSTGDRKWAYNNIRTGLPIFDADADWVLRPDFSPVYSTNTYDDKGLLPLPIPADALREVLSKGLFPHFFVQTPRGTMEIRGAPIQPASDYERKSAPQGYFLAGRLWDSDYLAEIRSVTKMDVDLVPRSRVPPQTRH